MRAARRSAPSPTQVKMPLEIASAFVLALTLYLVSGIGFALVFAWRGAARIDPTALQGTLGFRLLLLPGATLLWPWLAWRWWRGGEYPESNAHRRAVQKELDP